MKKKNLQWFEFNQNNSGGSFDSNDRLCHRIFIEAENASAADDKAISLGIYFDGCENGMDCSCCGDRWFRADSPIKFPMEYDKGESYKGIVSYAQMLANRHGCGWTNPDARLYYANGKVVEIKEKAKKK